MIVNNGQFKICSLQPGEVLTVDLKNLEYDFSFQVRGETVVLDAYFKIKKQIYTLPYTWNEVVDVFILVNEDEDKEISYEIIEVQSE